MSYQLKTTDNFENNIRMTIPGLEFCIRMHINIMVDKFFCSRSVVVLTVCRCDGRILEGSVFHRVNDHLETGVELGWTASSRSTFFGFGAKYCPDKDTTVRVCTFEHCLVNPMSDVILAKDSRAVSMYSQLYGT